MKRTGRTNFFHEIALITANNGMHVCTFKGMYYRQMFTCIGCLSKCIIAKKLNKKEKIQLKTR